MGTQEDKWLYLTVYTDLSPNTENLLFLRIHWKSAAQQISTTICKSIGNQASQKNVKIAT